MNTDPLTEAELARVPASLKTQTAIDTITRYYHASQDEILKLQRELLATREKLKVAKEAVNRAFWIFEREAENAPDIDTAQEWQATAGSFADILTQLNQP